MTPQRERFATIKERVKADVDGGGLMPRYEAMDKLLYIALKYQYLAYMRNAALPEEVLLDQKALADAFDRVDENREWYLLEAKRRNRISSELVELEKCGCEHCRRLIRLFDGREQKGM